ncbi:MAG: hypothetical protein QW057_02495 [Candidatus Bathyarchaeia archaeon]
MRFKEDWDEAKERLKAWWNGEDIGRPILQVTAPVKGLTSPAAWDSWSFVRYLGDPSIGIRGFLRCCEETFYGGEAYPNLLVNLGPGITAAYVGAEPKFNSETVWFETPTPWEKLQHLRYDVKNHWWDYTKKVTSAALEAAKSDFIVAMTDLGGILDVASSLRGAQNLVLDLFRNGSKVEDLCWQILELWHLYYDELTALFASRMEGSSAWMGIWSPKRWYPIQCDFSAMISPNQFERYAVPFLREQCRRLDHTVYHWDGPGQVAHLDHLLNIEELTGIQWTPGAGQPGVESSKWLPLYRRIQEKGKRLVLLGAERRSVPFLLKELSPRGLLIRTSCVTEEEARMLLRNAEKAA